MRLVQILPRFRLLSLLVTGLLAAAGCGDDDPARPATPLESPTMIAPAEGTQFDHFPRDTTLDWAPVDGADEYEAVVETCLGTCEERIVSTRRFTVEDTTVDFSFGGMNPGRWRVRAMTTQGNTSDWSEWRNFRYLR